MQRERNELWRLNIHISLAPRRRRSGGAQALLSQAIKMRVARQYLGEKLS